MSNKISSLLFWSALIGRQKNVMNLVLFEFLIHNFFFALRIKNYFHFSGLGSFKVKSHKIQEMHLSFFFEENIK